MINLSIEFNDFNPRGGSAPQLNEANDVVITFKSLRHGK